jgi:hypothetical protein
MIMRLVLASAALAAALFCNIPAGQAQIVVKPWCAMVNTGFGNLSELCDYNTFEECRPNVVAGNRGFCTENPRYKPEPVKHRTRRHVRAH